MKLNYLYLCLCALLLLLGCETEEQRQQEMANLRRNLNGENMQMRNDFSGPSLSGGSLGGSRSSLSSSNN